MPNQPKISIIMPIYNSEQYLDGALSCAVSQSLTEIEIICIDDGSTDQSGAILRRYAAQDSRIQCILHDQNMGPSISRKQGILAATGKYIMFLDCDDALDVDACKELFYNIETQKCDILQFGTKIKSTAAVNQAELASVEKHLAPFCGRLNAFRSGDLTNKCFSQNRFGFTLWNKIYKSDVVKKATEYYSDLRFDLSEDLYLFFLISFFSKSYVGIDKTYYHYQLGIGTSSSHRTVDDRRFRCFVAQGTILQLLKAFAAEHDPAGVTDPSLTKIADTFASAVAYNWVYNGDYIASSDSLQYACEHFDPFEIMSRVLEMYYQCSYDQRQKLVKRISLSYHFPNVRHIKTVGVFYFRIRNGGVERVISELIPIWISKGYQVILFTEDHPSPDDYPLPKQVERVVLPQIDIPDKTALLNRMQYMTQMIALHQIDTLVYNANIWPYALVDILAAKTAGTSVVMHTHSCFASGLKNPYVGAACQALESAQFYQLCDSVAALSEVDKAWWGLNHPHVYKMVNPLPFELNEVSPVDTETQTDVIWIARIAPEKHLLDALKIVKRVKELGYPVRLQVVGQADDPLIHQEVVKAIDEMGLSEVVHLNGFQHDVKPYYAKAGIFLSTSEFEGFMMTLTESKAYGIPAVLYDLPNLDLVQKKQGMIVVAQGNINAAAEAIISLLSDSDKRKAMGMEARKSVEELYSSNIADAWERMFLDISNHQPPLKYDFEFRHLQIAQKMLMDCLDCLVQGNQAQEHPMVHPMDKTLQLYSEGEIGFRYIIKYFIAWLKYKLFRNKAKGSL